MSSQARIIREGHEQIKHAADQKLSVDRKKSATARAAPGANSDAINDLLRVKKGIAAAGRLDPGKDTSAAVARKRS